MRSDLTSSQRPLRLMVLADKQSGMAPGQRYRLEQWGRVTEARFGIHLEFFPFESPALTEILYRPGHHLQKGWLMALDFLRRRRVLQAARDYDGVVIHRWAALIGPAYYEKRIFKLQRPTFFDFDDALWAESDSCTSVNGVFARLKFPSKTSYTVSRVTAVIAGNSYLAAWAAKFNENVRILPTSIDLSLYEVIPEPSREEPLVICWTGSTSTLAHFEHARGSLERLAARRRIIVKIICNRPPDRPIAGAENVFVPWQAQGEAQALGDCHIGIMPLPDDHYTRGKCGLKALQFMATGRPVVISPVGMNIDLVRHGENGFLAQGEDEWVETLEQLAACRELRARVGAAARRTVERDYSAEVVAEKFACLVRESLAQHEQGRGPS